MRCWQWTAAVSHWLLRFGAPRIEESHWLVDDRAADNGGTLSTVESKRNRGEHNAKKNHWVGPY